VLVQISCKTTDFISSHIIISYFKDKLLTMASASVMTSVLPAVGHGKAPAAPVDQVSGHNAMQSLMAWHGKQYADDTTFIIELTPIEISEVDVAVAAFECKWHEWHE
jgi:hypothetical protein